MKFILFFIILMTSFSMLGCEKIDKQPYDTFCIQTELCEDGSICQTIEFPLYCEDKNEAYIKELTKNIEMKLFNRLYLGYYLLSINGIKNGFEFSDIDCVAPKFTNNKISFSFNFKDKQSFNYFNSEGQMRIQLLETQEIEQIFPFSVKSGEITLAEKFYNIVEEIHSKYYTKPIEKVLFEYKYITPFSKLHSNANYVNNNQHSWIVDYVDIEKDNIIKIWVVEANRGWWYLTVIILMIFSFLGVNLFKKNKK